MEYGNYTHTWTDDFLIGYKDKIWNPDLSWMNLDRWDYLPNDYKQEPRRILYSDENCN